MILEPRQFMKDNFSVQSDKYALYRPTYPVELFDFINGLVKNKHAAWDCGTGNGQVAIQLTKYFEGVFATDISESQLSNAIPNAKIEYTRESAEDSSFPDDFFDLVVVAQAVHWFNFDLFYDEVNRVMKDDGVLAVIGYNRPRVSPEIDKIIDHFYTDIIGKYWDRERKYVDEEYKTIPFPFAEKQAQQFNHSVDWTIDHFIGYIETWSAVKKYSTEMGSNPIDQIAPELKIHWGDEATKKIQFPILLRLGEKIF